MENKIFENGFEVIEAVRDMDRKLKLGQSDNLSAFFEQVESMKKDVETLNGDPEIIYDFLGTVLNVILLVDPANSQLTDRMYKYYMIHRFMQLFGDHESVSDKVYITDKNVERFISDNGERDFERLVNILSQAGETLSRNMRKKLNDIIKANLSQCTSATIYFAVTNGVMRLDKEVCSRLEELCLKKKNRGIFDNTLFDPEYVVSKLRLYGYLNTANYDLFQKQDMNEKIK